MTSLFKEFRTDDVNKVNKVKSLSKKTKAHVSKNSGNDEWYTPPRFIDSAREVMGTIDLDPASNIIANQIIDAGVYWTKEDDALTKRWFGNIWMNPPFSAKLILAFCTEIVTQRDNYNQACVLVNNATETRWFNKICEVAAGFVCVKTRIKFIDSDGNYSCTPLQGQVIFYIGDRWNQFKKEFKQFGVCVKIQK